MSNYSKTEIAILKHLYKHGYIGKRHTPFENAMKGLPRHMRGEAKDRIEYLMKIGLVLPYPTGHGLDVRINPDRKLLALTVMFREDGYNPEHNDWFWANNKMDDNDYIFSGPLK